MARDLTDQEVARELGVHPRSIQRRCKAGTLPGAYQVGRSWRIPRWGLRAAELDRAFRPDELERELRAATLACRTLAAEIEEESGVGGLQSTATGPGSPGSSSTCARH